ncbi:hypothetical protein K435DRAFT_968586 [Dendrothele bispora CBS 962.96]|uniref:Rap1 Myb domain-containing protein n=1 Tax=Dendrothele bispora (strain CBS 962.96) TaxID=1314807 RepID=A0A4S8LMZ4_DENBC|nr:hypothetical protein K435DRAFT_968586 [Dendrothele bispora CBS 962.96]
MRDTRYKPHTNADDERLIQYLAAHDVRTGSASTYQSIVNNEDGTSPWGAERTWAAWRSRYAHHKHDFDRRIRQYRLKHGIAHRDDSGQSSNDQTQTTPSHFESQSPFSVSSPTSASGSTTGLNGLPACTTAISPYPSLSPATISPSKNMHLTLIAERVISSNRYSKPTPRRDSDTWMKDSPSLPSLSPTNSSVERTSDLSQKMTEDRHSFMTVELPAGSSQPSILSAKRSSSLSLSDVYEPSASDSHGEVSSPAPLTLPARMARKRQRPSIPGYEYDTSFSTPASPPTPTRTPMEKPSETTTNDDHREQEFKVIRTDSNKTRITDEKTEFPITTQSPQRLSQMSTSESDSRSSQTSLPQPKKPSSSYTPVATSPGPNVPPRDQVSKFSEFDNSSGSNFADTPGLDHVHEQKYQPVKEENDDLEDFKPSVSEYSDPFELSLSTSRSAQALTKTEDNENSQRQDRAVNKSSPSSPTGAAAPSPLVSIPSGLGWGGLGHLVG